MRFENASPPRKYVLFVEPCSDGIGAGGHRVPADAGVRRERRRHAVVAGDAVLHQRLVGRHRAVLGVLLHQVRPHAVGREHDDPLRRAARRPSPTAGRAGTDHQDADASACPAKPARAGENRAAYSHLLFRIDPRQARTYRGVGEQTTGSVSRRNGSRSRVPGDRPRGAPPRGRGRGGVARGRSLGARASWPRTRSTDRARRRRACRAARARSGARSSPGSTSCRARCCRRRSCPSGAARARAPGCACPGPRCRAGRCRCPGPAARRDPTARRTRRR